jgi:hypothetical protein
MSRTYLGDGVEADMRRSLIAMGSRFDGMEARFSAMEARFSSMETRFSALESGMDRLSAMVRQLVEASAS